MADERKIPRPIQVFLDTRRFIDFEEPRIFAGGRRDFFAGNDEGFASQKMRIRSRLHNVASTLRARGDPAGFVHVQMREDAFAKSYRPLGSLFTERNGFGLVGAGRVGEMIFQATPQAMDNMSHLIETHAELTPRRVRNEKTGQIELRVSGYRSEVGAIADVNLHDSADRVGFSVQDAVDWFQQSNTIGGYLVELFRPVPGQAPEAIRELVESLRRGLESLPSGIRVRPFAQTEDTRRFGDPPVALAVQLLRDGAHKEIALPFQETGQVSVAMVARSARIRIETDVEPSHHQAFLTMLSEQALVRSVDLPPLIEAAPASVARDATRPVIPPPADRGRYPVVGIIDGGVANIRELLAWRAGEAGIVPTADRDENHGTFIAGLVVAGGTLNPHLSTSLEPVGCKFFDLDLFPRRELRRMYYGGDIDYFFDLLDEKIKVAKREHNVRVFNLSFGLRLPGTQFGYTVVADRLDRLARANDVILIISAGNLPLGATRPPWSANAQEVLTMLAAFSGEQKIKPPAEHLLGLTVGALNPPGVRGHDAELPTTYTRRGPGIGGSRKPDLAHYGGAEPGAASGNRTGLASIGINGENLENCGTSFAAPNVAAMVATLDHRLEHAQSREVLIALPVHRAERAAALCHPSLRHISREFVGFGLPPPCDALLVDDPFAITLIFREVLHRRQKLEFPFSWPHALVGKNGSCRGQIDLTLSYTPPLDADHKDEAQRIQLEAYLHQEQISASGEVSWVSQLKQDGCGVPQGMNKTEGYLLRTGLKWSPIKRYGANMPQGRGASSNWRLSLESLTRAGARYPEEGVPFALVMTIADPKRSTPIHDLVRNALQTQGLALADITVAHRVRQRER